MIIQKLYFTTTKKVLGIFLFFICIVTCWYIFSDSLKTLPDTVITKALAADENVPLQVIALNRLMQVVSDSLLPFSFDVPSTAGGAPPTQVQIVDSFYCGSTDNVNATSIVLVYPAGHQIDRRLISQNDCSVANIQQVVNRIATLDTVPPWRAVSKIKAAWSPSQVVLSFQQTRVKVNSGSSIPSQIQTFITSPNNFKTFNTSNLKINLQGQDVAFNLAILFRRDSAILLAYPTNVATPNLTPPTDLSLTSLPTTVNSVIRAPHLPFNNFLGTTLGNTVFPVQSGGLNFQIKGLKTDGAINDYKTSGVVSQGVNSFNVTVDWQGNDLTFQRIRLAEAEVDCGPPPATFDVPAQARRAECLTRKTLAQTLQSALNTAAPQGKPLRPVKANQTIEISIGEQKYAVKIAVVRSSSTASSLQLLSSLVLEKIQ